MSVSSVRQDPGRKGNLNKFKKQYLPSIRLTPKMGYIDDGPGGGQRPYIRETMHSALNM